MKKDPTGFKKGPKKYFPSWFFGPGYVGQNAEGREDPAHARIFQKQEDVPEGWFRSAQEAKDFAAANAAPATAKEPVPLTPPARNGAKNKNAGKAPPVDERAAKVATLVKAGYDPKELEKAPDAELDAALKDLKDGANH